MFEPLSEAEAAGGLGTYVKPKDLTVVPDFEHVRGEPKNIIADSNGPVKNEEKVLSDNDVEM